MIPEFDEHGYLPPGIHGASLEEIALRFGRQSEVRRAQMQSVYWLIDLAIKAGVQRIVLNGSFVTELLEPNDVDCVLLIGPGFPKDRRAESELLEGLPFLEIELVNQEGFNLLTETIFATDRRQVPKGMIEVIP